MKAEAPVNRQPQTVRPLNHRKDIIMNISKSTFRFALVIALGCCCLLPFLHARAASGNSAEVPAIIQNGFKAWAKNRDASWAFDIWKIGGLLERDSKPSTLSRYFSQMDLTLGNYLSYEVIETKHVGQNSAVIYVSVNFAHAAIFGRFMMYQISKRQGLGGAEYGFQRKARSCDAVAGL
jgi:hypothetical protein